MFGNLNITTRLYLSAVLSVAAMALLFYGIWQGPKTLKLVYEQNVAPTSDLVEIDKQLKEIRFRMAAYLVDQMPAVGNTNQLIEAKERVPELWASYKDKIVTMDAGENADQFAEKIEHGIDMLTPFLAKLEFAYAEDEKNDVYPLLEDSWPNVHASLLKPIGKLIEIHQFAVKSTYEASSAAGSRLITVAGLLVLFVVFGLFGLAMKVSSAITRPLQTAVGIASRIAKGDLSSKIDVTTKDETGKLLSALRNMNQGLGTLVGEVRVGANAIASAAQEIAVGNTNMSQRTQQEASYLEETAASMEEFTSTVKHNADNAKNANELAIGARSVAGNGVEVVNEVVSTMASINDSSRKIVDIINVIDSIAFQTNILALNAAVEAARAGEQGRGFSVVASEVRALAKRSAAAAKEIGVLINNSVEKVNDGTQLVEQAGNTMKEIVTSIERVAVINGEISAASEEQAYGIEQVNRALTQMDDATQKNAALVEEVAATAKALEELAQKFHGSVEVFKLGDGVAAQKMSLATKPTVVPRASVAARPAGEPMSRNVRVMRGR